MLASVSKWLRRWLGRLRRAEATSAGVRRPQGGMVRAPSARAPRSAPRARGRRLRASEEPPCRRCVGRRERRGPRCIHGRVPRGLYQRCHRGARRRPSSSSLVLVGRGGYGRGGSTPVDLDLMLIHCGELTLDVQRMAQDTLDTLWDLGLCVGHACRSLDDCLALARTDLPSRRRCRRPRARRGRGPVPRAPQMFRRQVDRRHYPEFLPRCWPSGTSATAGMGARVYLQEPNVKESAGGLRDVQTASGSPRRDSARARSGSSRTRGT